MADLDHIGVSSAFDPSGFIAGLAAATAEFRTFLERTGTLSAPVVVNLKLSGITEAVEAMEAQVRALPPVNVPVTVDAVRALAVLDQVQAATSLLRASGPIALTVGTTGAGLSPAVFTEFGDAALKSLGKIEVAMTQLGASLQPLTTAFNNFFTGVIQGASEEAAAIERSVSRQRAARQTAPSIFIPSNTPGLGPILADLNALNRAIEKGTINNEDHAKAIDDLRIRYAELRAQLQPTAVGVAEVGATMERSGGVFGGAARSGLTLRSSLVVLASQATQTSTTFGRLLESVLLFSGGTAAVVAVAAPLLAIAVLYELLTKNAREATKATDDFIKSQDVAFRSRDAIGSFREAFAGVDEEGRHIEGLTARMAKLNQELDQVSRPRTIGGGKGPAVTLPADPAEIEKINQRLTNAGTASLQTILTLVDPILSAVRSAADQATKDQLSITQQGIALRLDAVKSGFDAELITRTEFFAKSRDLATQAARADVAGLQAQLAETIKARAHAEAGGSAVEKLDLEASERHLRAEITLRGSLLALTQQQSAELERQQKIALLDRSGIGTVAGISAVQPPVLADQKIALKPRIDLSEVEAQVAKFVTETAKIDLDNRFEDARLNGIALAAVLATINLRLKDIGNANVNTKSILTPAESLQRTVRGISDISTAFGQAGVAVGLFGQDTQRVFDGIASAAQDTGRLIADIASGNVLGAIASGIGAIGSIGSALGFGKSQTEKDLELAQRENTAALRRATLAYQQSQGQGRTPAEQQTLVGRVFADPGIQRGLRDKDINELVAAAARLGTTWDEIRLIALQFGITLEKDHRLVEGSSITLAKAMEVAAQAATHFGTSIDEQRALLDAQAKLGPAAGTDAAEQTARLDRIRQIQLDNLHLSDAEEARIRALDLSTEKGRAAFRAWEQSLLDRAKAGQLSQDELGGFKDVKTLLPSIVEAADTLNLLRDAAKQAAERMGDFNLPQGFRRAALAFETGATGPGGPTLPSGPPLRNAPWSPPIPGDRHTPDFSTTATTVNVGGIVIQHVPGESMTELATRVVEALRQTAMGQSGNSLDFTLN